MRLRCVGAHFKIQAKLQSSPILLQFAPGGGGVASGFLLALQHQISFYFELLLYNLLDHLVILLVRHVMNGGQ